MRSDHLQALDSAVAACYELGTPRKEIEASVQAQLDMLDDEQHDKGLFVDLSTTPGFWHTGLAYGAMTPICGNQDPSIAIVHACKDPCHRRAVGYTGRALPRDHPNYLALEDGRHLYLNMIDPPVPLFQREMFEVFLDYVDRQRAHGRWVWIHCNQGDSRAPALALLWLAKRGYLPSTSYQLAATAFRQAGWHYRPGDGIETWLKEHWDSL